MHFKSYGNAAGGRAVAHKINANVLLSNSKPSIKDAIEWTKEFPKNIDSAKDIEVLPSSGNVAVMLWSETLPVGFAVLKNNDGRTLWSKQYPQAWQSLLIWLYMQVRGMNILP